MEGLMFNLKLIVNILLSVLLINVSFAEKKENCQPFLQGSPDQTNMIAPQTNVASKKKTYILPGTPATSQWGVFDNAEPPVLTINSGDTVVFETLAAAANQVVPGTTIDQITEINT